MRTRLLFVVVLTLLASSSMLTLDVANAATTGTLHVQSSSTTSVYVDNVLKGTTDSWGSLNVQLEPGTYTVKLTKPGYKDWSKQVAITTGQTTQLYGLAEQGTGVTQTRDETIAFDTPFGTLHAQTHEGTNV